MNIASYGHKFFLFGGALLIAVAALQMLSRPRSEGKGRARRPVDATLVRAAFFVLVGIAAILVGVGVIPIK